MNWKKILFLIVSFISALYVVGIVKVYTEKNTELNLGRAVAAIFIGALLYYLTYKICRGGEVYRRGCTVILMSVIFFLLHVGNMPEISFLPNIFIIVGTIILLSQILYILLFVFGNYLNFDKKLDDRVGTAIDICLLFSILWRFHFYSVIVPVKMYADSYGYIDYSFSSVALSKMTIGRTPLYPFLLRSCFYLFGENGYLNMVTWIQISLSLVALVYISKIFAILIKHYYLRIIMFLLYAVNTSIFGWDKTILTESIILFLMPVLLYYLIVYLKEKKSGFAIMIIIISCIGTLIRPSFLLYFVLGSVFLILKILFREEKRKIKVICMMGFCWGILAVWSICFYRSFGYWSISDPLPRQNLIICIEHKYYKNSKNDNFISDIDKSLEVTNYELWPAMQQVYDKYDILDIIQLTKECISYEYLPEVMVAWSGDNFAPYCDYKEYPEGSRQYNGTLLIRLFEKVSRIFYISHTYIFSAAGLCILIYNSIKLKKLPWFSLGFFCFMSLTVLASFMGTCGEYARTMICVLPIMYVNSAWWLGGCKE